MYLYPSRSSGLGGLAQPAMSSSASALCPGDQQIDPSTAMLFSDMAPLARTRQEGCDHKAVWTFVPAQRPRALSVFIYLHGNNNAVPVDGTHPGGRPPDWSPRHTGSALRHAPGAVAAGPKYALGVAAQQSTQRPVVLVPEDVVPSTGTFWARGAAGSLSTASALGDLVADTFSRLRRLRSTASDPEAPSLELSSIRRLFLAGHSGGGVPLAPASVSSLALSVPTDLWLYDCTYTLAHNASYIRFCRHWKARGLLGNTASASRMAIFVTSDPRTTKNASNLVQTLRLPYTFGGRQLPGLTYGRLARSGLPPMSPAPEIVEAMPDATVSQIEAALRSSPVVFVHTSVAHDHIPLVWTPRLLATAATP